MARDNLLVSLKEEVKMILSTHEVSNHFVKFIVHLRAFSRGSQTGRTTTKILWTIEYSCLIAFKCQFSSVAQLCPTLCDPMNRSTPGLPVHHQLPESIQTQSQWCHPAISSSVVPFSSCPQSFATSGSFQMSQLFTSGGQSIGASASASVVQWTPRTDLL